MATELLDSISKLDVAAGLHDFYEKFAIPAGSLARIIAFGMIQPEDIDVNEILLPRVKNSNPAIRAPAPRNLLPRLGHMPQ